MVSAHDLEVIEDERVTDHAKRQRRRTPRLTVSERVLIARPGRDQSAA
jgi:hypothetical protein